jgi:hypothetical protein
MTYTATSHQTIAKVQGKAAMTRKVQPTTVTGRKAVLVQISWTDAPVIKTTVRKNFKISVLAMDTKNWTVIQRSMMNLKAGQVIHYTQSSEHPGYYYVTVVGESCTCVAGLYKQECHHQKDAVAFEASRVMEAVAQFSQEYEEKFSPQALAKWQAVQERVLVNLVA